MKKIAIVCFCFIIMIFAACGEKQDEYQVDGNSTMDIDFQTGTYHDKKWDESCGTYQNDAIPNEDVALNVAVQIFNGMEKSNAAQKYVPQTVFYDEQDEVWIVSFWEQTDEVILGGDCSIAIRKKDGQVLRIWFGE